MMYRVERWNHLNDNQIVTVERMGNQGHKPAEEEKKLSHIER